MFRETDVTVLLSIFFVLLIPGLLALPTQAMSGTLISHIIGIAGTIIILFTLIYPLRKRILGIRGKKNPISHHVYYGLIGSILVVLHAGHSMGSLIGNLVYLSMVLVVMSGIVGRHLFKKFFKTIKEQKTNINTLKTLFGQRKLEIDTGMCRKYLELENYSGPGVDSDLSGVEDIDGAVQARCEELNDLAASLAESEYILQVYTGTKTLFSRWIRIHIYLAVLLFAILIVHILTNLYYGLKWL